MVHDFKSVASLQYYDYQLTMLVSPKAIRSPQNHLVSGLWSMVGVEGNFRKRKTFLRFGEEKLVPLQTSKTAVARIRNHILFLVIIEGHSQTKTCYINNICYWITFRKDRIQ